jgi:hypothetical protein
LLVDLVEVGALDAETAKSAKDNMELAYADRSFYEDYALHIKREDTKDIYGQPEYVSDLSFLAEDSSYAYGYGQMQSESLDSAAGMEQQDAAMAEKDVIQKIERASMELAISKSECLPLHSKC